MAIPRLRPLALVAALTVSGVAHGATNLVINSSFEQGAGGLGSFTGWSTVLGDAATFVDSSGQTGPHAGQASSGLWSAYFGSTAASGGALISEVLATTAGQLCALTFDLANDNAGFAASNAVQAGVNGVSLFNAGNLAAQDYAHRQFSLVASGASTLLTFAGFNDSGYLQLDNVAVLAVPEPSTALLLLTGVGVLIASRRRQR